MDCAEALELVLDSELLEGPDFAPQRRTALEAHLRTCANCVAQSKGLERALATLRASGTSVAVPVETPIDLWPQVRATLAAEGRLAVRAAPPTAARLQRARWRWARSASIVSAAAVLAIALPLLWNSAPPSPGGASANTAPPLAPKDPIAGLTSASNAAPAAASMHVRPPEAELAVDSPATVAPAGKGGLRRALGEERRRDFAVPFEATGESAAWSLASDRELR